MSFDDEVDRAFAERRKQLLAEMLAEGAQLFDDLGELAKVNAAGHPVLHVAAGLAAGAAISSGALGPLQLALAALRRGAVAQLFAR